jgi:hypothetical protein
MTFNGWANWETWNVALWIANDEGLYNMALEFSSYKAFRESLRELAGDEVGYRTAAIGFQTPDGVAWNDSGLDVDRLDEMLKENREEEGNE